MEVMSALCAHMGLGWQSANSPFGVRHSSFEIRQVDVGQVQPHEAALGTVQGVVECGGWRGMGLTPLSTGSRRSMLEVGC